MKEEISKICKTCGNEKTIYNFSKKYKLKDGTQRYQNDCKECVNIQQNIRRKTKEYIENKEIRKTKYKNYYQENRERILEHKKEYHIENQEVILEKKREYRKTEEYKINNKKYRDENKDKYREIQKRYRNKHPHIVAWRNMLYRTLSYLDTEKQYSTKEEMGYSAVQLKHHIEKQFKDGMTWENYGEWEIDHIRPLTSFGDTSLVCEVNALSNLQPLWKEENIAKYNHF